MRLDLIHFGCNESFNIPQPSQLAYLFNYYLFSIFPKHEQSLQKEHVLDMHNPWTLSSEYRPLSKNESFFKP